MNIEKAKLIAIPNILEIMGYSPKKSNERELWYSSPFRDENTPSFHVTLPDNVWYDFGEGKGGDSIALVCEYLKHQNVDNTVADALRWLRNMSGYTNAEQLQVKVKKEKPNRWLLKKAKPIENIALINYLKSRGIALGLAEKHLKEVYVRHSVKPIGMYALGLKNEDGGYDLRNVFLKGCVYPKNISFTRAEQANPQGINIFEGMMDFLSTASQYPDLVLKNDNITLNSASMIEMAFPYIDGYGYKDLYDWSDNDKAGKIASGKIKDFANSQDGLKYKPMQPVFAPHKDVNEWHMHVLKLSM